MKRLLPLLIGIWLLPFIRADVTYNYPKPDIINISNDYNDYFINLTSGIQITNHYEEYWSENLLCVRTNIFDRCINELPFLNWSLNYSGEYLILKGTAFYQAGSNNATFIMTYSLYNDSDMISWDFEFYNNLNRMLSNVWFDWKIQDIKISNTYEYDAYKEFWDTYLFLNETQNYTTNFINGTRIQIEDYTDGEAIIIEWNHSNYEIDVVSEVGQYNTPVTIKNELGDISSGSYKKLSFKWVDIPACTGFVQNPVLTKIGCVNSTGGTDCNTNVDNWVNISYRESWTIQLSAPSGGCTIEWLDDTSGIFNLIPVSTSDPQEYCQDPHAGACISPYPINKSEVYSHIINCTSAGNWTNKGHGILGNVFSSEFDVECLALPVIEEEISYFIQEKELKWPLIFIVSMLMVAMLRRKDNEEE